MGWQVMNNFVFHEEYIVDIPAEKLTEFLNYIVQYGLYNKVPSLKGFELVYWKTIQRRIDNDKNFYEITCLKRKINAINVRVRNNKASENDLSNLEQYQTKLNELNEVKRDYSFNTKLNELNEKTKLNSHTMILILILILILIMILILIVILILILSIIRCHQKALPQ